jgi:hypothetical protein
MRYPGLNGEDGKCEDSITDITAVTEEVYANSEDVHSSRL